MKNVVAFFIISAVSSWLSVYAQITEENYLKEDSTLWANFENRQIEISKLIKTFPQRKDSIKQIYNKEFAEVLEMNIEIAKKYASVPSGLQRLYMTRGSIPKDSLANILNSLSDNMKNSFYGRNIREHITSKQLAEGDSIIYFACTQADGERFDWDIINNKQLLLLYGGLGCMGEIGRSELAHIYENTSREDLVVVVYWPSSNLKDLQDVKAKYPSNYILVSDFLQDASPIKIKYGSQSTPTCFLTDKNHIIKVKCTGFHPELFNDYIDMERNNYD